MTESGIIYGASFHRIETDLSKTFASLKLQKSINRDGFFQALQFFILSHKSRSIISGGCLRVTGRRVFFTRPREKRL